MPTVSADDLLEALTKLGRLTLFESRYEPGKWMAKVNLHLRDGVHGTFEVDHWAQGPRDALAGCLEKAQAAIRDIRSG